MEKKQGKAMRFRLILSFIKPYRGWLILRSLGALLSAAIDIFLAFSLLYLVDSSLEGNHVSLTQTLLFMSVLIAVGIFFSFLNRYLSGRISGFTIRDIRSQTLCYMEKLPVHTIESLNSGDLISRLTIDMGLFQNFLADDLPALIFQPLRFIGAFALLFVIQWKLLLFCIIVFPLAFLIAHFISKPMGKYAEELQQCFGEMNGLIKDTMEGIQLLKIYNLQKFFYDRFQKTVAKTLKKGLSMEQRNSLLTPVDVITQIVPFVLCILYGGSLSIQGVMTPGALLAFIQMMNYLVEPAGSIPGLISNTKVMGGVIKRLEEILNQETEPQGGGNYSEEHPVDIEFDQASFSYDLHISILEDVSLSLEKHKTYALVGQSGGGKSTLLKLICGFYSLQGGRIKIFGQTTQNWNLEQLRKKISWVSQDAFLFPATIIENISYGREEASLEEIFKAASLANAHEFIMKLPDGYNTLVGERGANLSGGQKQRIALARAILKDAPLLLLDEPTSALDPHSEALIQKALETFAKNRTVLIIAHRLSTIINADEILVFDRGKIVEKGRHQELIRAGGAYQKLYMTQLASHHALNDADGRKGVQYG